MAKNEVIQYFVEGECEQKFINSYKMGPCSFLKPGKVEILNMVNNRITKARARSIKQNTVVVLVYDIDQGNPTLLEENIRTLKECSLTKVIHVQSVKCFEDEVIRSTKIKKIDEMFSTQGKENFKTAFINHGDIVAKLKKVDFNQSLFWTTVFNDGPFSKYVSVSSLSFIRKSKIK